VVLACSLTAAICFTITAATGFASGGGSVIRAGQGARFPVADLLCVAEFASGDPRFRTPGVACSSYRQPYKGIGVWFGTRRIILTRPPNGHVIYTVRR